MTKQEFMAMSLPYNLCVISDCDLDNRDYDEICAYKPYHYADEFLEKFIHIDLQLPIIHPLSDLTKEIEHNGERFVPMNLIYEDLDDDDIFKYTHDLKCLPFHHAVKLLKWHFNLMDESEEFIDVNTLPRNPYK